jgi:hypothetical protein
MTQLYISITGLRVKSGFATMRFWWLIVRAMIQAKKAIGISGRHPSHAFSLAR